MLFFELLQVALENRERLSKTPSAAEWMEIYVESERQAVTGLLVHGIDRLPAEQRPSKVLLLQWIGVGQMIEQRNRLLNGRCKELLSNLTSAGLHPTILKGQGITQCYPEVLRNFRQPGDIDVYVSDGREKAIEYARSIGQKDIDWDYQHLHLKTFNDVEIELHYRVEILFNLFDNKKLQRWFRDNKTLLFTKACDLTTPSVEINVVYILLHIYRHFLTEGVGMRQLLDYYYVLKKANGVFNCYADGKTLVQMLQYFGIYRFATGVMWVLQETCGMKRRLMICNPDENEGSFILSEVMAGGNFGHYDERLKHTRGKLSILMDVMKHNLCIFRHYPSDAIWASTWLIWHKIWKVTR